MDALAVVPDLRVWGDAAIESLRQAEQRFAAADMANASRRDTGPIH